MSDYRMKRVSKRERAQRIAEKIRSAYRMGTLHPRKIAFLKKHNFVFVLPDKVANRKKMFLLMAENGEPKPKYNTKLGGFLHHYLSKKGPNYDPVFEESLKKANPSWVCSGSTTIKNMLLKMAENGEPKPQANTKLGVYLYRYLQKSGQCYDPVFEESLRKVNPSWLVRSIDYNKEKLLEMARNGEPRPTLKTKIGVCLSSYTRKSSAIYDPVFEESLRKVNPSWFITQHDKVAQNKEMYLEMARNGEPKPSVRTKEGWVLASYLNKKCKCYDAEFDAEIRRLAPHWFKKVAA